MLNEIEFPDRLSISKPDRKDYERLKESDSPLIKGKETLMNKDLFILAMTMGVLHSKRKPLENKDGYIRTEYLSIEDRVLIKALSIWETNDVEVLLDPKRVIKIAEEYANSGIKYLKEMVLSTDFYIDFSRHFEKLLLDKLKEGK